MSSETGRAHALPEWVEREWREVSLRVKLLKTAEWLWERVLTSTERYELGDTFPEAYKRGGTVGMWRQLYEGSVPQAVVAIARRLNMIDNDTGRILLDAVGEAPDDSIEPDQADEWAAGLGGLVVVESPRKAYWEGELIDIDWGRNHASWQLLWALAREAKSRKGVTAETYVAVTGRRCKRVKSQKSRLVNAAGFSASLGDKIVPLEGGDEEGYKLAPSVTPIRVFEVVTQASLREWHPQSQIR